MKKIGKIINYFTKIFLVIGLLFSNLSGLSVVFAYEGTTNFTILVDEEKNIVINYLEELNEEDDITITVNENYKYLDGTIETNVENTKTYDIKGSELSGGISYPSSMLNYVKFDGLYELSVSIESKENGDLGTVRYSKNIEHESGYILIVTDELDNPLTKEKGIYLLDKDKTTVKYSIKVLPGGLSPNDVYLYDDYEYSALEIISDLEITSSRELAKGLFGEYTIPVEVTLTGEEGTDDLVYTDEINVLYGKYEDNTNILNSELKDDSMYFEGDSKDNKLFVYPGSKETSIRALYELLNSYITDSKVSYVITNSLHEDVLKEYDESTSLEEYLDSIMLDNSTKVILTTDELSVTYSVMILADIDNDGKLTIEDLTSLINQLVGIDDVDFLASDINSDDELTLMDAINLLNIIKTQEFNLLDESTDGSLEAKLESDATDIVSGDEFDVKFIVSLDEYELNGFEGIIKYNEESLELVEVTNDIEWTGNNKDGVFLYVNEESIQGTYENEEWNKQDYTLLTFKFKALAAGEHEISLDSLKFASIDGRMFDTSELDVSTIVNVAMSCDNTLSSLSVSGVKIELVDGTFDYEIKVSNDVTSSEVLALVNNPSAKILSVVSPEKLVDGKNEFKIVVVAEDGQEQTYTIKVNKEAAPKENEPANQINYSSDQTDDTVNEKKEEDKKVIIDDDEPEEEDNKETDEEKENGTSRIIIIILILLVIAGLIYLIFKDDNDDDAKNTNREINKLKKEKDFSEFTNKVNNKSNGKNNKKGR